MEKQLEQAVSSLITTALNTFEEGAGFLSEQLPDVIQQLLIWKAIESFIYTCLSIFLFGFYIYAVKRGLKAVQKGVENSPYDEETMYFLFCVAVVVLGLITLLTSFKCFSMTWLQILVAPKIFLIEYAATLLSK